MSRSRVRQAKTGLKPDGTNYVCPFCLKKVPRTSLTRLVAIFLSIDPLDVVCEPVHDGCGDIGDDKTVLSIMTRQRRTMPHFTDSNGTRHW